MAVNLTASRLLHLVTEGEDVPTGTRRCCARNMRPEDFFRKCSTTPLPLEPLVRVSWMECRGPDMMADAQACSSTCSSGRFAGYPVTYDSDLSGSLTNAGSCIPHPPILATGPGCRLSFCCCPLELSGQCFVKSAKLRGLKVKAPWPGREMLVMELSLRGLWSPGMAFNSLEHSGAALG